MTDLGDRSRPFDLDSMIYYHIIYHILLVYIHSYHAQTTIINVISILSIQVSSPGIEKENYLPSVVVFSKSFKNMLKNSGPRTILEGLQMVRTPDGY